MILGSKNYGFRRLALLCVAAGILGLLFGGCPQPSGGGSRPSGSQYTITFDSHGGSVVQPVTANVGTAVSKPADPTWTGYTFVGWFKAETGGVLYSWPHTLTANITMHAQWQNNNQPPVTQYTITFNSHGGSEVQPITVNEGTAVSKPVDPTWAGYTFLGWFNAETGGVLYSWPHTLTSNITMHAQWRPAVSVNISVWINEDGNILSSGNDITISKSASGTNAAAFSAGVSGAYSGIQWYLNEDPISGSRGTAQSITINAADYENGSCYLGVSVSKDGVPYSTIIRFTVID
jgi:uncharacterized repeat protein (TIGR02543 family)